MLLDSGTAADGVGRSGRNASGRISEFVTLNVRRIDFEAGVAQDLGGVPISVLGRPSGSGMLARRGTEKRRDKPVARLTFDVATPSESAFDIGLRKIVANIKQAAGMFLRHLIGEAVPEIEGGPMRAPAPLLIGLGDPSC